MRGRGAPLSLRQHAVTACRMQPARRLRGAGVHQLGPLDAAALEHARAARIEGAAARNGVQARHGAVDLVELLAVHRHVGNGGHQAGRVRVRRLVDDLVHRADLGDAAGVHHRHAVAGLGDHAHVVRDQHHRCAALTAHALEQLDDLRLDRHVERGGRLVGHDQLGLGRQRQRDHHALAHAARELVRVVVDALLGGGNAGVLQQLDGTLARLVGVHRQVGLDGLDQLAADAVERVQRGQRILEDGADLAAADVAHLLVRQMVDALALQQDLAAGHAPGRLQQADDGRAGERLAGARLAHHAQDLARCNGEGNVVQRAQRAAPAGEFDDQVLDF